VFYLKTGLIGPPNTKSRWATGGFASRFLAWQQEIYAHIAQLKLSPRQRRLGVFKEDGTAENSMVDESSGFFVSRVKRLSLHLRAP
jgi:hypothetical protein